MYMEKTHIMNIAMLNNLLLTLSQSGIVFYGKSSSIPSEAISRQPYHQPFYKSERHTHMELISRLEGEPAIWINTNWTIYRDDKAKVFLPGTYHTEHFSCSDKPYKLLWCTITTQTIIFHITAYTPLRGYSTSTKRLALTPPMARKLWEISISPELETSATKQAGFHYLLMEALYFCVNNVEIFPAETADFHYQIIEQLKRYVEDYYWDDITLDSLAGVVHYSSGHLNSLFKKQTGVPLHHYISEVRMKKAGELLSAGSMLVRQAAEAVGIHDPLYFSKKFRKHFGVSPQEFSGLKK
jgi:AraC-like DNA-binding protein